ncbi:three-helix bundle dimerization domain-containing protein [Dactylosporangium sp. CA-139066]|uniref:three-helix bundle dimerization domain-containing protein n=1 Tax=Dactylosporangium sp. CA-139066 TaxID=3239930 RepID=UPI003D8F87DE
MLATQQKTIVEAHAIEHATERLIQRYAGRRDPETVRRIVARLVQRYSTADVHAFVPVLVERDARRILDATTVDGPAADQSSMTSATGRRLV